MMTRQLDEILEQSLSQMEAGQAGVEGCLAANPAVADELEPLLRTADRLRAVPKPVLAAEARARIEALVLDAAAADPRLRPASRRRLVFVLPKWRWAYSALMAFVLFALLMTTTLVTASADALPGSALYPIKRASEGAWLWLTPSRYEAGLHLQLAERRLAEFDGLAGRGVFDHALLEEMAAEVDAALADMEGLPADRALVVLDGAADLLGDEQARLARLLEGLPIESRRYVEGLLVAAQARAVLVEAQREWLRPSTPTALPQPTETPTPSQGPGIGGRSVGRPTAKPTQRGKSDSVPTVRPTRRPPGTPTPKVAGTRMVPPTPKPTREPVNTRKPTNTPKPKNTKKPTKTPDPEKIMEPVETPEPTETKEPTKAPEPTETLEPTETPEPAETDADGPINPPPTKRPKPSKTPKR